MTAVAQADSTYSRIETKVRRLTACSSQSSLSSSEIQKAVNTFYSQDFPYGIKIDQMRSVYRFFTQPNIDRYPMDVNFDQGVRAPMYVDGIQGSFYKDRQQFFSVWPKFSTLFKPISGDGVTTAFTFTIPGPFYSNEVTLGGVDSTGAAIAVADDGNGKLQLQVPNPVVTVPPYTDVYTVGNAPIPQLIGKPIPGMHNQNTLNPGLNRTNTTTTPYTLSIGTVNYVTGVFNINFPVAPIAGKQMTLFVAQYTTGRPISLLFWNNEFTIRPCPKLVHRIEVETFLTPVQFMLITDVPILNQWYQYIAYGAAIEILRERQDMEGVNNLMEGFKRQEALVLERQGIEELFVPTPTLFNSVATYSTGPWGNSGSASW